MRRVLVALLLVACLLVGAASAVIDGGLWAWNETKTVSISDADAVTACRVVYPSYSLMNLSEAAGMATLFAYEYGKSSYLPTYMPTQAGSPNMTGIRSFSAKFGPFWNFTYPPGATPYIDAAIVCWKAAPQYNTIAIRYTKDLGNASSPPTVGVTASATGGASPFNVILYDASTGSTPDRWYWRVSNNATATDLFSSSLEDQSAIINTVGEYDVEHWSGNAVGWSQVFKPKYLNVTVGGAATAETVQVTLKFNDMVTGSLIPNVAYGLYDYTHGEWKNGTAATGFVIVDMLGAGGTYPVLQGDRFLVYASATGYTPKYANVTAMYAGYSSTFWLHPTSIAPSATNGTISFSIVSNSDSNPVSGARITVTNDTALFSWTGYTNVVGGMAYSGTPAGGFRWGVSKSGYQTAGGYSTVARGTTTSIDVSLVATGATPTPTVSPGSTYTAVAGSTPTLTGAAADQANMDLIRANAGTLIWVAIIMTVLYLIGYKP